MADGEQAACCPASPAHAGQMLPATCLIRTGGGVATVGETAALLVFSHAGEMYFYGEIDDEYPHETLKLLASAVLGKADPSEEFPDEMRPGTAATAYALMAVRLLWAVNHLDGAGSCLVAAMWPATTLAAQVVQVAAALLGRYLVQ